MGFESYTGYFHLAKLEKEIALLESLSDLSKKQTIIGKPLQEVYSNILEKLKGETKSKINLTALPPSTKKALMASVPWFLLVIFISLTGRGLKRNTLNGIFIVATPFIIIGTLIPTFETATWINYYAYPFLITYETQNAPASLSKRPGIDGVLAAT